MNDDLISRKSVLAKIQEYIDEYSPLLANGNHDLKWCAIKEAEEVIKSEPSVQPKTGRWIDITVGDVPAQACDQCKTFYLLTYTGGKHHYCPNCGAKMEMR